MNPLPPPTEVAPLFDAAGWYPGRIATDYTRPNTSHPAAPVLASFAGLMVRPGITQGLECAAADMHFCEAENDDPVVREWADLLQTELIGVAECHDSHELLLIASDGRCFGFSYIHEAFYFYGSCFSEAAANILIGRRAKPMLHPKQSSVTLYGEVFERGDPELYAYT
jgi:hypothetical protein